MNLKGLKLVFCCPGELFTKEFLISWTDTVDWAKDSGINAMLMTYYSSDLYLCRNGILTQGAQPRAWEETIPWNGQVEYDYLMWIDSDERWRPEDIERLLSHEEDIVSGIVPIGTDMRIPTGYFGVDALTGKSCLQYIDGKHINRIGEEDEEQIAGDRPFKEWMRGDGVFETHFCGFGFLLVKNGVFEKIGYPWFTMEFVEYGGKKMIASEDVGWCMKARKKGFSILVDSEVRVGHKKEVEFTVRKYKYPIA